MASVHVNSMDGMTYRESRSLALWRQGRDSLSCHGYIKWQVLHTKITVGWDDSLRVKKPGPCGAQEKLDGMTYPVKKSDPEGIRESGWFDLSQVKTLSPCGAEQTKV